MVSVLTDIQVKISVFQTNWRYNLSPNSDIVLIYAEKLDKKNQHEDKGGKNVQNTL